MCESSSAKKEAHEGKGRTKEVLRTKEKIRTSKRGETGGGPQRPSVGGGKFLSGLDLPCSISKKKNKDFGKEKNF